MYEYINVNIDIYIYRLVPAARMLCNSRTSLTHQGEVGPPATIHSCLRALDSICKAPLVDMKWYSRTHCHTGIQNDTRRETIHWNRGCQFCLKVVSSSLSPSIFDA